MLKVIINIMKTTDSYLEASFIAFLSFIRNLDNIIRKLTVNSAKNFVLGFQVRWYAESRMAPKMLLRRCPKIQKMC